MKNGYMILPGLGSFHLKESDLDKINKIIKITSSYYEVPFERMCSRDRFRDLVWARHVTIFILKRNTRLHLTDIGRMFRKHHTSCIHAIKMVSDAISIDETAKSEICEIESKLFGIKVEPRKLIIPEKKTVEKFERERGNYSNRRLYAQI